MGGDGGKRNIGGGGVSGENVGGGLWSRRRSSVLIGRKRGSLVWLSVDYKEERGVWEREK